MSYQPPPPPPDYGYQQQPPSYGYPQQDPQTAGYANWGYRVGSTLLDSLIAAIPGIVLGIIGTVIGGIGANANGGGGSALAGLGAFIVIIGYLGTLAVTIWNIVIRQGSTGQSIGKQVLGTRLVSLQTGQPIGAGMTFVRAICHILDGLPCYIGYLWPLWDARRQTFADKIIGTVVVRTA
jgi:uncharacterized RDD family membrane protein YckC